MVHDSPGGGGGGTGFPGSTSGTSGAKLGASMYDSPMACATASPGFFSRKKWYPRYMRPAMKIQRKTELRSMSPQSALDTPCRGARVVGGGSEPPGGKGWDLHRRTIESKPPRNTP